MKHETKKNDPINPIECKVEDWQLDGLTKREYFAAMALQGILAFHFRGLQNPMSVLAEQAVKAADSLIEELNK